MGHFYPSLLEQFYRVFQISDDPENPTLIYFVVAPMLFEEGFTVTMNENAENSVVKTKSGSIRFEQGTIMRMAKICYDNAVTDPPTQAPMVRAYSNGNSVLAAAAEPIIAWTPVDGATQYGYSLNGGTKTDVQTTSISAAAFQNGDRIVVYAKNAGGYGPASNEVTVKLPQTLTLSDHPDMQGDGENVPAVKWTGDDNNGYTLTFGSVNGEAPSTSLEIWASIQNGENAIPFHNGTSYLFDNATPLYHVTQSYLTTPAVTIGQNSVAGIKAATYRDGYSTGEAPTMDRLLPRIYYQLYTGMSTVYCSVSVYNDYASTAVGTGYESCNGWPVKIFVSTNFLQTLISDPQAYLGFNFLYGTKTIPVKILYDPELMGV